jgi:hypothetical protein
LSIWHLSELQRMHANRRPAAFSAAIALVARVALVALVALLIVLPAAGCAVPVAPTAPAPSPLPTSAPAALAARLPTAVAVAPPIAVPLTVTLGDDGNALQLNLDQRFLLSLDGYYDWTVTVDDPTIVSRLPGLPGAAGSQGVFQAAAFGQTTLSAVGDPPCRQVKPACGAPSRIFRVTLVVR